jgi:hypothetical protein
MVEVVEISVENLIVEVRNETRKPSTMDKDKQKQGVSPEQEMGADIGRSGQERRTASDTAGH